MMLTMADCNGVSDFNLEMEWPESIKSMTRFRHESRMATSNKTRTTCMNRSGMGAVPALATEIGTISCFELMLAEK
jgi:hypothetical protein